MTNNEIKKHLGSITTLIERLESFGYVGYSKTGINIKGRFFRLLKSPKNDYPRDVGYGEMLKLLEAEEKIKLRSKRIENILVHGF